MTITMEAIYENGLLRPLSPLPLPDQARVRLAVDDLDGVERTECLAQSQDGLSAVWDNDGDEVFNELLAS
ncbi:MAG: antitoxin AF2212-like protein [Prosthecobacter sp.]|nr:antitoxin AF2212-like protein [Prosthecobacter sp.]